MKINSGRIHGRKCMCEECESKREDIMDGERDDRIAHRMDEHKYSKRDMCLVEADED